MANIYMSNLQPSPDDSRDYMFQVALESLPSKVDLRVFVDDIENQLSTNSCTANAGAAACEIWSSRANQSKEFSKLFLYYNERELGGMLDQGDKGANMRDICGSLHKTGICEEHLWPFDPSNVQTHPSTAAYDDAKQYLVGRYERLGLASTKTIKTALAKGFPVLLGMYLAEPFFGVSGPINTHLQYFIDTKYSTKAFVGAHAMLIVGYDDSLGGWIVQNSWGVSWGDNGYVLIPYGLSGIFEMWTFTEFANYNLPDMWQTPESPPLVSTFPASITFERQSKDAAFTDVAVDLQVSGGIQPYEFFKFVFAENVSVDTTNPTKPIFRYVWPESVADGKVGFVSSAVGDSTYWPRSQSNSQVIDIYVKNYVEPVVPEPVDPLPTPAPAPVIPPEPTPLPVPTPSPSNKSSMNIGVIAAIVIFIVIIIATNLK